MAGSVLLSRSIICSIIAAGALHRRVRNGNGCYFPAMATSQKGSQEEDFYVEEMRLEFISAALDWLVLYPASPEAPFSGRFWRKRRPSRTPD